MMLETHTPLKTAGHHHMNSTVSSAPFIGPPIRLPKLAQRKQKPILRPNSEISSTNSMAIGVNSPISIEGQHIVKVILATNSQDLLNKPLSTAITTTFTSVLRPIIPKIMTEVLKAERMRHCITPKWLTMNLETIHPIN